MVVSIGRRGYGLRWAPPHHSIHKEAANNQSGEGGLLACIFTVHGGVDNAGDDPDGVLVGSIHGKRSGRINKDEV